MFNITLRIIMVTKKINIKTIVFSIKICHNVYGIFSITLIGGQKE